MFQQTADTTTFLGTNTWYNSFHLKLDRRFSDGLFLTTSYTFSKGLNYSEDNGAVVTPLSIPLNKGHMADNRTHVFTQSYMYELPFGRGKRWALSGIAMWMFGGWQFQGFLSVMTGQWFSPSVSGINNALGNAGRPDWISPVEYLGGIGPGQKFFSTSSFRTPAQNTLGTTGRNILEGPGIANLDAALHREFRIREGMSLELRVESFNFTNTPHYSNPNGNQDQRQYQFGLALRF